MSIKSDSWTRDNIITPGEGQRLVRFHPSELMLRVLLSDRYVSAPPDIGPDTRILDIGAMRANNLVPFHDRGCQCFGIEINEDMVAVARECAEGLGIGADFRAGSNRSIPYEDGFFDLLLAINVVHYEDNAGGLRAALKEYRRVLGSGGTAFVVTCGPDHYIRTDARRLDANVYEITADDFRKGQIMAYFEDEAQLADLMGEVFSSVETGRMTELHPKATVDFLYAIGRC